MPDTPEGEAREFHLEMLEALKLLNRVEEEHGPTEGLERDELVHLLGKAGFLTVTVDQVGETLDTLIGNGLARRLTDSEYAWDRGRVVGERFAITSEGKRLLLKELEKVGRV